MRNKFFSKHKLHNNSRASAGFTIIELVVVISVIGILAGIVSVSYSGWNHSTVDTKMKSDLSAAAAAMENSRTFGNVYPGSIPDSFSHSSDETVSGGATNNGQDYCVSIVSTKYPDISYYLLSANKGQNAQTGSCPQ